MNAFYDDSGRVAWLKNNFGWVSLGGVMSALLAQGGMPGNLDLLDNGDFSRMCGSSRWDSDQLSDRLGKRALIGGKALGTYVARRLLQSVFVLIGVSSVVFALMYATGDPVALLVPPDATVERIQELRTAMGFDRPLVVHYLRFLRNALTGSFPASITYNESPARLVLERLPATLALGAASVVFACLVAVPVGLFAA